MSHFAFGSRSTSASRSSRSAISSRSAVVGCVPGARDDASLWSRARSARGFVGSIEKGQAERPLGVGGAGQHLFVDARQAAKSAVRRGPASLLLATTASSASTASGQLRWAMQSSAKVSSDGTCEGAASRTRRMASIATIRSSSFVAGHAGDLGPEEDDGFRRAGRG